MANSKQKPVPEGTKRSPGKSKFSIPRKEAPPIDGSYLDRLFADYERQSQEAQTQIEPSTAEESVSLETATPLGKQTRPEIEDSDAHLSTSISPDEKISQPPPDVTVPFSKKETALVKREESEESRGEVVPGSQPAATLLTQRSIAGSPKEITAPSLSETLANDAQLLEKWKKNHRLGKGEVKVLRVMLGLCRESGGDICFVKISQLMEAAELKERQTQLVLRSLRELGLIEKVAEYSNVDRLGTKYRVAIELD